MMIKLPALCAAFASLVAAPLAAQDAATSPDAAPASEQAVSVSASAPAETLFADTLVADAPFAEAAPIDEGDLALIAGREDINQLTNAEQNNSVNGNDVGDNSVTGTISLSDQAFANSNGFVILNANTGNNVAINASIQVNIALPSASAAGQ
jgi:hypothetical protein